MSSVFQRTILVYIKEVEDHDDQWYAHSDNLGGVYTTGNTKEEAFNSFTELASDLFDPETVCLFQPMYNGRHLDVGRSNSN